MDDIEARLNLVKVPKGYLAHLYTLREHVAYVRKLLLTRAGTPPP